MDWKQLTYLAIVLVQLAVNVGLLIESRKSLRLANQSKRIAEQSLARAKRALAHAVSAGV